MMGRFCVIESHHLVAPLNHRFIRGLMPRAHGIIFRKANGG